MTDQEIRLKFGEMNAGEMRLARALVAWHEREIAKLKAEIAKWHAELSAVMPADFKDWHQNSPVEWPVVAAQVIRNLRAREESALGMAEQAQAELAALRTPILADDGRSLVDVYGAAFDAARVQRQLPMKECCDSGFKAVAAVVEARMIQRMEAVPVEELRSIYNPSRTISEGLETVRARLVAAAKGEGQAQEVTTGHIQWHDGTCQPLSEGPPVVVNEVPKDEEQPDLSGENGKQEGAATKEAPATFEAHGYTWTRHTPGDPMPCDGEEVVQCMFADGDLWPGSFPAKDVRWTKNNDLGDVVGWRYADEPAQSWTPAVGDTVRLKSGGPAMTVTHVDPLSLMCAWMNASNELQVEPITTLCLEPAQP